MHNDNELEPGRCCETESGQKEAVIRIASASSGGSGTMGEKDDIDCLLIFEIGPSSECLRTKGIGRLITGLP